MTKKHVAGLVPAVTLCLATLAVGASSRQSVTVELPEATALNGTQLSAGTYTISWMGEGPEVAVTVKKSGKVVAETRGKLVDIGRKAEEDAVVVRTDGGGSKTLTKVQFGGRKSALVGALDRTRRPAAGCDQQRLPKAIGPASASVSGTVAS